MADIDRLKEIKSDLREIFKALLYMILGLLTGIVTIIYKILIGTIPAYISIVGMVGLIVTFLIILHTLKIWNKMQEINEEMKNVD
jgi:xanthosine utilization system XapX-like protein